MDCCSNDKELKIPEYRTILGSNATQKLMLKTIQQETLFEDASSGLTFVKKPYEVMIAELNVMNSLFINEAVSINDWFEWLDIHAVDLKSGWCLECVLALHGDGLLFDHYLIERKGEKDPIRILIVPNFLACGAFYDCDEHEIREII